MRTRLVFMLAPLLLLAGCAGAPDADPGTSEVATPESAVVTPEPTKSAEPVEPELIPVPDDTVREDAFLAAMTAIDPGLTVNADRALSRADNICLDISQGADEATILRNAEARYEGGTVPDLSADQAQAIVSAAREFRC